MHLAAPLLRFSLGRCPTLLRWSPPTCPRGRSGCRVRVRVPLLSLCLPLRGQRPGHSVPVRSDTGPRCRFLSVSPWVLAFPPPPVRRHSRCYTPPSTCSWSARRVWSHPVDGASAQIPTEGPRMMATSALLDASTPSPPSCVPRFAVSPLLARAWATREARDLQVRTRGRGKGSTPVVIPKPPAGGHRGPPGVVPASVRRATRPGITDHVGVLSWGGGRVGGAGRSLVERAVLACRARQRTRPRSARG